jgi:broad specificity phosphatase PhoE
MSGALYCVRCGTPKADSESKGRLFLIRHGQTDGNKEGRVAGHTDIPLNAEGVAQAEKAAELLKDKKIDVIVSSDLLRARMTAEAIAKTTGAEIIYDSNLRERNWGKAEGLLRDEWKALYPTGLTDYFFRFPDGESYEDLEKRAHVALELHRNNHANKNIVIVAHGGTIRVVLKLIRDLSPTQATEHPGIPNAYPLELEIGEPCAKCGSDLYEDPKVLEEFLSHRATDPIYQQHTK